MSTNGIGEEEPFEIIYTPENVPDEGFFYSRFINTQWIWEIKAIGSTSGILLENGELKKVEFEQDDNPPFIIITPIFTGLILGNEDNVLDTGHRLKVRYEPVRGLFPLNFIDYQDTDEITIKRVTGLDAWGLVPSSSLNIIHMQEDIKSSSQWEIKATAINLDTNTPPDDKDIFIGHVIIIANYDKNRDRLINEVNKRR